MIPDVSILLPDRIPSICRIVLIVINCSLEDTSGLKILGVDHASSIKKIRLLIQLSSQEFNHLSKHTYSFALSITVFKAKPVTQTFHVDSISSSRIILSHNFLDGFLLLRIH